MEITTMSTAPTLPTGVGGPTGLHTTGTGAVEAKKTLDKEVFLALLVAQLRHQDPTAPMDTSDMMAQSTQLASMEQLTSMADTSRESFALQMRIAALGLVGQTVSYVDAAGTPRDGVVAEVSFATDVPMVRVGDHTVPLDAVAGARAAGAGPAVSAPVAPAPQDPAVQDTTTQHTTTQDPTGAMDGAAPSATDGDPTAGSTASSASSAQAPQTAGSTPAT